MKVVIFGATGLSGKAILAEALSKNHQVTILVRNAQAVTFKDKNLKVIEGSVLDKNTVNAVLKNQDAVIQSLGVGGKGDGKPTTFVSDANKIIMEEMEKTNVKRLIAMSNIGAGNSLAFTPWIFRKLVLPYFMKWLQVIVDDKNRMEPMIMNSNLDWTIVRSAGMVDKPAKGKVNDTLIGEGLKLTITLADLAKFMVDQIEDKKYIKQAPSISN
ncbi:MAG: NAD(P)H-binding protein [Chitinophagales bacterium]|nr:NAD(P)H-binding protein [Chitinophagales bacterium]